MFTLLVRLLAFPAAALVILYLYMRLHAFRYWQRRNIPAMAASFPFGNFAPLMRQADCIGQVITDIYNATSHRIIGIYGVQRPMLVVRDPELIQQLFVKDFAHFVDRGVYVDEVRDPLSAHLFALSGDRWRQLRNKLSPVFTSGKLKASMDTLLTCGRSLHKFMMEAAADGGAIEVREIAARFNTDVIASVAFGAEVNCMVNPETAFRKYGRQAFELSLKNGVRAFMLLVMPQLQRILGLKSVDVEVEDFIMELVRKTLEHRESGGVVRKDLFQLLLQLRNEGRVRSDDDADVWKSSGGGKSMGAVANGSPLVKSLTVEEVAAQAWIFYAAGFETSSSTMSFALFELARNMQCQRRVQEEIDRVMAKYGGQITYESLAEMRYLEMCIDETLRKYPIVPILNRECTQDYQFPNSDWRIEKGTAIIIPVLGLQRDERYYEAPLEFRPERFAAGSAERTKSDRPYYPFGDGPRICIGLRLAKMQTKIGLIQMLKDTSLLLADESVQGKGELVFSYKSFVLAAEGGIRLRAVRR